MAALLCLALAALAGCERSAGPLPLVGTLERDRIELVAEANEPIIEIGVDEGDPVSAGQVLLQLDTRNAELRVAQARAAQARAAARLAELERGPRSEVISEGQAGLEGARSSLVTAEREYDRVARLVERKLLSPSELDTAYAARESARARRDEAQARLAALTDGTTVEELDQARAAQQEAEAALQELEISRERLTVIAPRPGVVEALPYELGERPPAGAPVAVMLGGAAYARVYVPESLRAIIRPGMAARVRIDGLAQPLPARVRFVASEAAFTPYYALTERDRSRLSFLAEVVIEEGAPADLPIGMPVEVDLPGLDQVP